MVKPSLPSAPRECSGAPDAHIAERDDSDRSVPGYYRRHSAIESLSMAIVVVMVAVVVVVAVSHRMGLRRLCSTRLT